MFNVNSRKCLNRLSLKSIKANRTRNIIAIIAVILTAIMFTSLFTIGASILDSMQKTTMRQVGTSAHGGFKFITWEQYEKIKADKAVKDISYNISIGFGENKEFNKTNVEVRYTEEKAAKWGFTYPTEGTLPKDKMDIATSTKVLDLLGLPHEIGTKVPLKIRVNSAVIEDTFSLCGFWESDAVSPAEEAYLSREYEELVAPVWHEVKEPTDDWSYISGSVNPTLWFSSSWNIEKQVKELKKRCGFDESVNDGVNWAYASSEIDFGSIALIICILLLIMFSGYLIIYNIFYISVSGDIKFYGLLKTIGMTNKQLKGLVRKQAFTLGIVGGILGLSLGYGISVLLVPVIMSIASEGISCVVSANPFIFLSAGAFTLLTVLISCIKPCRLVSKISPVEAVRYTENKTALKKKKKSKRVTTLSMAVGNIKRTPKKAISVVLSLSLSMIMLNSTITLVRGFDMDKYIENSIVSDFYITDATISNSVSHVDIFNSITPEIQNEFKSLDGIKDFGSVYMREQPRYLTDAELERIHEIENEFKEDLNEYGYAKDVIKQIDSEKAIYQHIYGVDDFVIQKMEMYKGRIDTEKFKSGNYVIATTFRDDGMGEYYRIGDRVLIDFGNGNKKEYEVMAFGDIPYPLGPHHGHLIDIYFTMPSDEFIKQTGETGALSSAFDSDDSHYANIREYVKNRCENTDLDYKSKETYEESFGDLKRTYMTVGVIMSFILALIGILNFINSCITSISARKRELAVLQSVGMTGRQLKNMLILEGMCYALITAVVTLSIGTPLGYGIVRLISGQLWFFTYRFTLYPVIIAIPFFAIIAVIVPIICYKKMHKNSIVERLKITE